MQGFLRQLQRPRPGLTLLILLMLAVVVAAVVWTARTHSQDDGAKKTTLRDVEIFLNEGAGK